MTQTQQEQALLDDPGYVDQVLREGAERAEAIAAGTLQRVHEAVGLR